MRGIRMLQISAVMTRLAIGLRFKPVVVSIAISALLLVLPAAHAQAIYGSIVGTVIDGSGAVVPGITVTLKDLSKGTVRTTETDSTGSYSFRQLIPDP